MTTMEETPVHRAVDRLFDVTIRRVYTEAEMAKPYNRWRKSNSEDFRHPEFGDSAEEIAEKWDRICSRKDEYWDAKYKDHLAAVVELDLEAELEKRRDYVERVIERVRGNGAYAPCCDRAVLYPCVCSVSYLCPLHGNKCHGTHD